MGKTVAAVVGVVAAIGIAIAAPYLAPIALHAILGATAVLSTTAIAIATAVISIGLSLAVSLAFKALGVGAPKAKDQVGPPQVFRQSISNSFIVYGEFRVGGLLVFYHARQSGSDHYRYFVVAVAGHRCKDVVSWMLNDEVVTVDGSGKVTSGQYANNAWLWFQRGLASETANATFVSECGGKWTSNHKGNGVCAFYAKFKMADAVVQAGMPNMTAIIEGRDEILDSRDATEKYTQNGALIFYDFNRIPREEGGFGAYTDEIPDDDWISAQANVCDETVNGAARYALNGVIQTGAPPADVRDALVVNVAGTYGYSGGKHLMRVGYWPGISTTLAEDDLASAIQISPFMTADTAATEATGTFMDPGNGYQGSPLTTWDRPGATDILQADVDLAFTTAFDQGNRVLAIMGKRAGCEKTVVWPMNIAGLSSRVMDYCQLDSTRYGLANYAWLITNWSFSFDPDAGPGIVFSLKEENSEIYDDGSATTPSSPPTISQPSGPIVTGVPAILRASYPKNLSITSEDAGTDATIHLFGTSGGAGTDFTIDYASDTPQDVTVPHADITGLSYATTYYIFADVVGPGDDAPSYGAVTNYGDAINSAAHPNRIYLNQLVTTPASGGSSTGGTSGGGGYGGGTDPGGDPCVTDDTLILMAKLVRGKWVKGAAKPFKDCKVDDRVWTRSEATGEWGAHRIVRLHFEPRPVFDAGKDYPRASEHHRFENGKGTGWLYIESIGKPAGEAVIGQLFVADAKTYMTARPGVSPRRWVLSHNEKP